jgi:hypothetical protein
MFVHGLLLAQIRLLRWPTTRGQTNCSFWMQKEKAPNKSTALEEVVR